MTELKNIKFSNIKALATRTGVDVDTYIRLRGLGFKFCNKCKSWKNAEESFYKRATGIKHDGFNGNCKTCCELYEEFYKKSLSGRFVSYKKDAKKRNIGFNLTLEEFETFWQKSCIYCGSEIETIGIDRKNSMKGYYIENCVPCCKMCNEMKLDYTEEAWMEHMTKILKFKNLI